MFLLPSLLLGVLVALVLGGRPGRLLELELRRGWTVFASLALQIAIFTPVVGGVPLDLRGPLHLASYALLFAFAAANVRTLALLPLFLGMAANAAAIAANNGRMPVSLGAWRAAGIESDGAGNVVLGGTHLTALGDIFALPRQFPLANVFSVGDLLIAFGAIAFVVSVSTDDGSGRRLVPARLLVPLRVPSFRRLAAGKLVSHVGDWLTIAALVGWIYENTQSTAQVAVLMLVRLAPPILGGGIAAALVDRLPRERLLVSIEAARGAAVGAALVSVLLGVRPLAFAAVAVSGALAAVSAATVRSLVPSLLDDEHLVAANAGLGVATDGAMAIGALGAGVALTAASAETALVVDIATFCIATALYWGVRARPLPRLDEESEGLAAGLRYLLTQRLVLAVILAFGSATLATGLVNATLPRFLGDELGLGPGAYGYGLGALAAGLTAGQALVGFTRVGKTGGRWIGAALVLLASLFVLLSFTRHAPTAILILGLIGLVDGTTDVLFETIVQREADPRYYGRVFGFASAFMTTTMMGAVATAPLLNHLGPPNAVILVAGVVLLGAAAVAVVGTNRAARPAEAEPADGESGRAEAPALTVVPPPIEAEPAPERPVRVVVRLRDGDRLVVGSFPDREAAVAGAREVVRYVASVAGDEWPYLGDRFVRPALVVSVDLEADVRPAWLEAPLAAAQHAPLAARIALVDQPIR